MELKVWVDGIQRVVCGVTDSTTCQDVVYALAHATGQTGRFTLIEKWRNSERLLAPHEHPLKVLTKWGEYANDVQFVMRRSQVDAKGQSPTGNQGNQSNKRQHDFLHSFSPTPQGTCQKTVCQNKEIKKSLTFSCGHGSSGSTSGGSSENSSPNASNSNTPSKVEPPPPPRNLNTRDSRSRQDLPKGVVRGVPQKPKESESQDTGEPPPGPRVDRPKHPPPYDEAVSRSSGRFPPSHLLLSPTNISYSRDEESPSSKRRHVASNRVDNINDREAVSPHSQGQDSHLNSQVTNHTLNVLHDYSPKSSDPSSFHGNHIIHHRGKSPSKSSEKNITTQHGNLTGDNHNSKSKKNLLASFDKDIGNVVTDLKLHSPTQKDVTRHDGTLHDPQYQDLMRLVTLQREKLDNQQSELTQYDAEIIYWEGKLQEQEERIVSLQEEIRCLERTQHDQEGEVLQLERSPLTEDVELCRQEERTLRSELTLARSQLANCEAELLQCRQRIRLLLEEISEERRLRALYEEQEKKEREEQEVHIQNQMDGLQQQLQEKSQEYENQQSTLENLVSELKDLETRMLDKEKEVEKLAKEIREANLQSLSLVPAEDGKLNTEGSFHNRPGSSRKIIGSPRQLENAVPTNKNPHGVWV